MTHRGAFSTGPSERGLPLVLPGGRKLTSIKRIAMAENSPCRSIASASSPTTLGDLLIDAAQRGHITHKDVEVKRVDGTLVGTASGTEE